MRPTFDKYLETLKNLRQAELKLVTIEVLVKNVGFKNNFEV